jgi:hypothetical protein
MQELGNKAVLHALLCAADTPNAPSGFLEYYGIGSLSARYRPRSQKTRQHETLQTIPG